MVIGETDGDYLTKVENRCNSQFPIDKIALVPKLS